MVTSLFSPSQDVVVTKGHVCFSYELVIPEEAGRTDGASSAGAWLAPGARLPPIKLEKLERRRARHRRAAREQLSEEQIIERLERAEERRRDAEMEKVRRLTERAGSARPTEVHHLKQLARLQRNVEKFENTLENREQHIQNLRDKLRQHHEHAAVIRLKRSLAVTEDETSRAATPGGD
ncbi:hypothetical protein B566_EDAN006951 [Ephemera danica]|nr:hypothetical protein B566_EDAN006951 [Ephemera danica]